MSNHVVSRAVAATAALGLAGSLAASVLPAHSASAGTELRLTFEGTYLSTNAGQAPLTVRIVTHNGGRITESGAPDGGTAARFPTFRLHDAPQAVITVTDRNGGVDQLSPGSADFRFGAQFRLDDRSTGSSSDNGDNLIQRGLYDSPTQYKLQLDDGRPSCRVKGGAGAVSVRSSRVVPHGVWHRASCSRSGSEVVLSVVRLSDSRSWTYRASGRTGTVSAPPTVPLSVGGKVSGYGNILSLDSDQFNGSVDNAFLDVL
jgi:hypothetical protein